MTNSKEIKKALANAFKGTKFSVTTRNVLCETITVKWVGSVFISQVKEITDTWNTFQNHSDIQSDYFHYTGTQIELVRRLSEEELDFAINGIFAIKGTKVDDSPITFKQTEYSEGFSGDCGNGYIASAHNDALESYHWNGLAVELDSEEAENAKSDYLFATDRDAWFEKREQEQLQKEAAEAIESAENLIKQAEIEKTLIRGDYVEEQANGEVLDARRDRWEEKQTRKAESYERLANKHESLSDVHYQASKRISDMIPFGQPILVGHHSEKHHRRDADKIWDNMGKSVEHQKTAEYYKGKLAALEGNTAISSDDPDAIAKLEAKLSDMEQTQEHMKAVNKIARKRQGKDATIQELRDKLSMPEILARELLTPNCFGGIGYASYQLQNNNANIRRVRERVEQLKKDLVTAAATPQEDTEYPELGLTVTRNYEASRMQLFFDSKPPADVRNVLKSYGFRWSPSEGAWQRHLTNAQYATESTIAKIQELAQ